MNKKVLLLGHMHCKKNPKHTNDQSPVAAAVTSLQQQPIRFKSGQGMSDTFSLAAEHRQASAPPAVGT